MVTRRPHQPSDQWNGTEITLISISGDVILASPLTPTADVSLIHTKKPAHTSTGSNDLILDISIPPHEAGLKRQGHQRDRLFFAATLKLRARAFYNAVRIAIVSINLNFDSIDVTSVLKKGRFFCL